MTDVKSKVEEDAAAIRAAFQTPAAPVDSENKLAKILEKVRGLLAKAEGAGTPEEADAFRSGADKLMAAYAIEQWQVEQAQAGVNARVKPGTRYFSFEWFYTSDFSSDLWSLFQSVARHCRCVVAVRGHGKNGHSYREIPVIGLASDLDYFDLLFTSLMLQMGNQLEPKPDKDASFDENAYRLRASGMARPRVARMLYDAGMIPGTGKGTDYWDDTAPGVEGVRIPYGLLAPNKEKSLRAKVRVAGERWGAANGHDATTTVNPKVWQRSFSRGFVSEIHSRLYDMRRMQEGEGSGESTALALRDIYQVALDVYNEMFPPPQPVPGSAVVRSGGRSARLPAMPKMSAQAINAGRSAGRKADISASPNRGVRNNPRPLPRG